MRAGIVSDYATAVGAASRLRTAGGGADPGDDESAPDDVDAALLLAVQHDHFDVTRVLVTMGADDRHDTQGQRLPG